MTCYAPSPAVSTISGHRSSTSGLPGQQTGAASKNSGDTVKVVSTSFLALLSGMFL